MSPNPIKKIVKFCLKRLNNISKCCPGKKKEVAANFGDVMRRIPHLLLPGPISNTKISFQKLLNSESLLVFLANEGLQEEEKTEKVQ